MFSNLAADRSQTGRCQPKFVNSAVVGGTALHTSLSEYGQWRSGNNRGTSGEPTREGISECSGMQTSG